MGDGRGLQVSDTNDNANTESVDTTELVSMLRDMIERMDRISERLVEVHRYVGYAVDDRQAKRPGSAN